MSKTPKELAEEYCNQFSWNDPREEDAHNAFLAGYQAAKDYNEDTLLAAFKAGSQSGNNVMPGLSGYIPADFNDFLLSLPAKDQVADADKVKFCVYCNDTHKGNCAIGKGKNHPAVGFSKIVVKIESSWVSVKDRLPEDGVEVLVVSDGETGASWHEAGEFGWAIGGTVTHWAPLPAAPKEEV